MKRRSNAPTQAGAMLAAAGLGAAMMYFLDPGRGARRRILAGGRAGRLVRSGADEIQRRGAQVRGQLSDVVARTRSRFGADEPTDVQLAERVRAALGHHTNQLRGVAAIVHDGIVTLRGSLPATDLRDVLRAARKVRGVREVHDELSLREVSLDGTGQPA